MILAALLLATGLASAKKPPKPPPAPVDDGVIYYGVDTIYSALPDGSDNATVTSALPRWSPPSEYTHGGERWFLTLGVIEDGTYPDGRLRYEVFAVSESGESVQVTDAPDVQPRDPTQSKGVADLEQIYASLCWADGDTRISYVGREWSDGEVVDGGIYYADLPADVSQMTAPVTPACVSVPMDEHLTYGPHVPMREHSVSWSPDGAEVAYATLDGVFVEDEATGTTVQLTTNGYGTTYVRWSPDGSKIMYCDGGAVITVNPDGTGSNEILAADRKGTPDQASWSPSGSHVVFRFRARNKVQLRVATAEGKDLTTIVEAAGPYPHWVSD
ncbi:MAG: TolB family protein, partial [Planctomycetota bacterium]|jgi:hypothetical protein